TDLLVTVFLLTSFLLYSKYREHLNAPRGVLCLSVFAAAMAMLSKESAAMYPLILLVYERMRKDGREPAVCRQFVFVMPFLTIVVAYMVVRFLLFGSNLGPGPGMNRIAALAYAPLVLVVYVKNLVWPWRLSFYYPIEWVWDWTALKVAALLLLGMG